MGYIATWPARCWTLVETKGKALMGTTTRSIVPCSMAMVTLEMMAVLLLLMVTPRDPEIVKVPVTLSVAPSFNTSDP
jgi:hypothetical protein